jgi:hypothetical protein
MKIEVQIRTRGVDVAGWRDAYYSDGFSQLVVAQTNVRERQVEERTIFPGGGERCRVRVVPDVALPGPVRKLVGEEEIFYTEVSSFDPGSRSGQFEIDSPSGDDVRVTGEVRYHQDDGIVEMRFVGEVKVKIFAVGGLVERFIAGEVRKRYAALEPLLQRYVDQQTAPS